MGTPYFNFGRLFGEDESDPLGIDKLLEEERKRKEEEAAKQGILSKLWEDTKWLMDSSPLKPIADFLRAPGGSEAARTIVPGYSGLEAGAGGISGLGALAGMGMNLDAENPDKFRNLPENWREILSEEFKQGVPELMEQVAPIDIATIGASGLAGALPKVAKLAKLAKTLDVTEGLYGVENVGEGILNEDPQRIGVGLLRGAGGLGGLLGGNLGKSELPSLDVEARLPNFEGVTELPSLIDIPEGGFKVDEIGPQPLPNEAPVTTNQTAEYQIRQFSKNIIDQFVQQMKNEEVGMGVIPDEGTRLDLLKARGTDEPSPSGTGAEFYGTKGLSEQVIEHGGVASGVRNYLKNVGQLNLNPSKLLAGGAKSATDLVHNLVDAISHELSHSRVGDHPDRNIWKNRNLEVGKIADVPTEAQTMYDSEFSMQVQKDVLKQKLYDNPLVQNLLETSSDPNSPISKVFDNLRGEVGGVRTKGEVGIKPQPLPEEEPGITIKRSSSFKDDGNYDVTVDNEVHQIFRDPGDSWWYLNADSNLIKDKFYASRVLGFNKAEAVSKVKKLVEKKRGLEVKPQPLPDASDQVLSEPANILRKILTETKLTRFNKSNLVAELEAKGIPVPEEVKSQLGDLLGELKNRGLINEKVGGTYTLLVQPPKRVTEINKGKEVVTQEGSLEDQLKASLEGQVPQTAREKRTIAGTEQPMNPKRMKEKTRQEDYVHENIQFQGLKEKLTPDEIKAIGKLFGGPEKLKGKLAEVSPEIEAARKAAIEGGKKKGEILEEPTIEESSSEATTYNVTLSDGTTYKIRAESPEAAQAKAEETLAAFESTKTVDKVEKALTKLEQAAKYEIDPTKQGFEEVKDIEIGARQAKSEEVRDFSEQVKETERLRKAQIKEKQANETLEVKDTEQLGKQEEKLRKAQTKEKFKKNSYTVLLSNGETITYRARSEKAVREHVQNTISKKNSNVTITSITNKLSPLEKALDIKPPTPEAKKSGFLDNPIVKALNAVKAITFGGDIGHLLNQGKQMNADLLFSRHAKKVLDQFPLAFKFAKSDKFFKDFHEKLYSDPDIKMMVDDFNLDMPGLGKNLKEEVFHGSDWAENASVVGKWYVQPSERIYTGGLNFLRSAEVKKLVGSLKKDGFTPENAPEKYRAVARAINIMGQRGEFSPAYQKLFSDASAIFGAPRAKAARIQNAFELFKGGESADILRKTAAKTLAFNVMLYGGLVLTKNAKFVDDRDRSDFLKIKIGSKVSIDPWMGLGITARTVNKILGYGNVSVYTGIRRKISTGEALKDEFIGGIAPGIKLVHELLKGEDLRGYQVDRLAALLNIAPMSAKGIIELLKAGDIEKAIGLSLLQFGGEKIDVFNYKEAKEKENKLKQERGLSIKKKKHNYIGN